MSDDPSVPAPTPQPTVAMPSPESVALEQMTRRAMMTVYTMISQRIRDHHHASSDIAALIDLLIANGTISYQEMVERRKASEDRLAKARAENWEGPQLHVSAPAPEVRIDCDSRQHACQSACCRLYRVNLTAEEVREGQVFWDLAVPYALPRRPNGDCVYLDPTTIKCTIWAQRPSVCRQYSCDKDDQVWADFNGIISTDRVKALTQIVREKK
ncbi:MAG: YkgJ family cysteine cluster protein [Deltaproteobacteria bacterium]|nr:YkgJ family cysteine cluster protein [Deltaproteobacteria bacterium]MCW5809064.1 YkgJ family cysteine cluster protein [Deltaproteobacteria bacterium]